MAKYAENTSVPSDRSRAEIEKILTRYGADQFMYGWEERRAIVVFKANGRMIKFILPMPDRDSDEFKCTPSGKWARDERGQAEAYEKAVRQRWRALCLAIKAKLECVDAGIASFEEEFMAYICLPDGKRMSEWAGPQIALAYETKKMPPLMLACE